MKTRLDQAVFARKLTQSRSEAESWIKLGNVSVDGRVVAKPGHMVSESSVVELKASERYVSRAGLKLASVAGKFGVEFTGTTVLDVGSSTGGFTDYALQHGAAKVIAVDVGTDQLHPSLQGDPRIELHEKTDIREVSRKGTNTASAPHSSSPTQKVEKNDFLSAESRVGSEEHGALAAGEVGKVVIATPDIIVIDVSFISLREILPHVHTLLSKKSIVLAMLKPQFEAGRAQVNKGIIKNDSVRREILRDFEAWVKRDYIVADKADSEVAGAKGNRERFYMLKPR